MADNYDCKFIEVSAILNHKVDDLLVGILKQIRLNYEAQQPVVPEVCSEYESDTNTDYASYPYQ